MRNLILITITLLSINIQAQEIYFNENKPDKTTYVDVTEHDFITINMWGSRLYKSEIVLSDAMQSYEIEGKLDKHTTIWNGEDFANDGKSVNYGPKAKAFWRVYLSQYGYELLENATTGGGLKINPVNGQAYNQSESYILTFIKQ